MDGVLETLPRELQELIISLLETSTVHEVVSSFLHSIKFSLVSKQWTRRMKEILKTSLQHRRLGGFHVHAEQNYEVANYCLAVVDLDTLDTLLYLSSELLAQRLAPHVKPELIEELYLANSPSNGFVRSSWVSSVDGRLLVEFLDGPKLLPGLLVCWRASFHEALDLSLVVAGPIPHSGLLRNAAVSEHGGQISIFYTDDTKEGYHEMTIRPEVGFTGKHHKKLHRDTINALLFSRRDQRYILAPADDHRVSIYDRNTQTVEYLGDHEGFVLAAELTADDKFLITAEYSHTLRVFDFAARQLLRVLEGFDTMIWNITTGIQAGIPVMIGSSHGRTIAWRLDTFDRIFTTDGSRSDIERLELPLAVTKGVSKRGEYLLVGISSSSLVPIAHLPHLDSEVTQIATTELIFDSYVPL